MRRFFLVLTSTFFASILFAETDTLKLYKKQTVMIPMRDGIRLHTVIMTPVGATKPLPFLITRTPYGASFTQLKEGETFDLTTVPYYGNLAKGGYIFVFQDVRGKYKSEGTMQIHQPVTHLKQTGTIDESTDTWDAVDWLVKNTSNNNGKAG